jgi:hypothetical protein
MAVAFVGLGAVLLPLVVGTRARTASGFMTKFSCREELRFIRNLSLALLPCGGDGKGIQCPGVQLDHPVPGGYKYGDLAHLVGGDSRTETIRYGLESFGTQTRSGLHWGGPAATINYRPVLSSERALRNNKLAAF